MLLSRSVVPASMSMIRPRRSPGWVLLATTLTLLLADSGLAEAKAYKGAEVYSSKSVLYGRMEMRMRMLRGSGLLSTFFTYKNGSELAGSLWEELDIEALGKNDAKTWQTNIITGNPRVTSEQFHQSPTSLADDYHTYMIEWTPTYVSWSLDGTEVRRTEGGQASELTNPHSFRFNVWSSDAIGWVGELDESALPAYQFVNWIRYYRFEGGQFVLDWTDDFARFDTTRWAKGNWSFTGNRVDFDPANAVVQDGTLVLAITKEGATGFTGSVPVDPAGDASNAPIVPAEPIATTAPPPPPPKDTGSDSACSFAAGSPSGRHGIVLAALGLLALASASSLSRRRR
jgi:endo-1,3-1,4-beta-glycanase ExoK